uniref:dynactin-associated protein isoform X1 n=1 Tax=Callithrix jacchus TaxID=9483 RepID=UPI00159DA991|nr:dynactin-associated protein isoform X1 [Callithrix jacchus]
MLSQSQPVKDIKGNEQIEKYSWREACDIGSSRMDRKHGTYVLNVEHSVNQLPIPRPNDQEAHSSIRWCPPSNDITSDVSPNLAGVCVSPGVPAHSRCLQSESCNTQVKEHCHSDWSTWKVFLACLLACVITTAIGVLIICLLNNKGSANSSIVIQLSTNNGECVTVKSGAPSTACPPTINTTSSVPTETTTSTS